MPGPLRSALLFIAAAIALHAQTVTVIANFNGTDGATPNALIQGSDGNFYGTTSSGGTCAQSKTGCGTVFSVTPSGTITVLYNFDVTHGVAPTAPLIKGNDGNFYGVTPLGGTGGTDCLGFGCGTVFKITPSGTLTTVYSFVGPEGYTPSSLVQGSDGNFYGTTAESGGPLPLTTTPFTAPCSSLCGTVFKLTPAGVLTTLHSFTGGDGVNPVTLLQGADGNLYGATLTGGAGTICPVSMSSPAMLGGCGTVFKITTAGSFTILHSFGVTDFTDGWSPQNLIQATDGNLYGTTLNGGNTANMEGITSGVGTVFKVTTGGALTTLYSFTLAAGAFPGYLMQASDGNFYGSTSENATCYCGTIFRMTPGGSVTTLAVLGTTVSGRVSKMVQGSDGNLYGGAQPGTSGKGAIFKLSLSLAISTSPAISTGGIVSGASFQPGIVPGSWMTIEGSNLSTVTDTWANSIVNGVLPTTLDGVSVSVGGAPAYIYYVSPTQINAIAPNVMGNVAVTVTNSNGTTPAVMATAEAEQPAFFQYGTYAVATRQDYSIAAKNGTIAGLTTTPAKPGDVIILWGTGFGPTTPSAPIGMVTPSGTFNTAPVMATVGGMNAMVYGAALTSGDAGLYQVAIQMPALADGDYPVVATVSGAQSPQTALITVEQ